MQQRLQQQEAARQMMYQNTNYDFERRDKKTLILDVEDASGTAPLSKAEGFSVDLFEPLIIDKLSDVYIDNFSTFNSLLCDTNDRSAFSLSINEFLALTPHATAVSQSHFTSSRILSTILVRVWLCLSQRPFDHGEYAGVVAILMLKL